VTFYGNWSTFTFKNLSIIYIIDKKLVIIFILLSIKLSILLIMFGL